MPSDSNQTRPARVQGSTAAYPSPNLAEPLPCPRCNSIITKFCYYNNYNLLQPRYFCKSCRRYWTQGGTLRDVPIGGGTRRKRNRSFSSSAATASSSSSCSASVITMMSQGTVTNEAKGSNLNSGHGSFTSLLSEQSDGAAFLALGSGSGSGGLDYEFGYGYGLEDMSIGCLGGGSGGEIPVVEGGDTWQIGEIGGKSGDSLIWPGLDAKQQC
ncbi:hypothetical protein N665_0102s0073 [Sinapis alba]|nr:hypothetical protein N665_0102s0073 [Sinapis alba]